MYEIPSSSFANWETKFYPFNKWEGINQRASDCTTLFVYPYRKAAGGKESFQETSSILLNGEKAKRLPRSPTQNTNVWNHKHTQKSRFHLGQHHKALRGVLKTPLSLHMVFHLAGNPRCNFRFFPEDKRYAAWLTLGAQPWFCLLVHVVRSLCYYTHTCFSPGTGVEYLLL